jgi:hypothetical protein
MATLLALLALLQSPPVAESSGLFAYQRPADWRSEVLADGTRFLRPPGDSAEVVRFLLPEGWTGTPEAFHETLHAALRQGTVIISGGKIEAFGGFLRSEAVVGSPGQPQLWMALYTAKSGESFQGIIYAGPTAAGFARHRAAADGVVRSIELPGPRERASGFELTLPKGWKREDDAAQGTTSFFPGDLGAGPPCGLVVLPAREAAGVADGEYHDQMWAALTATAAPSQKPARSEHGLFRSSRAELQGPQGKAYLILYTARRGSAMAADPHRDRERSVAVERQARVARDLDVLRASERQCASGRSVMPSDEDRPRRAGVDAVVAGRPRVTETSIEQPSRDLCSRQLASEAGDETENESLA